MTGRHRVAVLRGLPGSGKTRFAGVLRSAGPQSDVVVVSVDDHFMHDGVYRFDPAELGRAHAACFRRFVEYLQNRPVWTLRDDADRCVIVDNTNTTAVELAPYMAAAAAFDYDAEILEITCPLAVAAARQTHGVPAATMERMAVNLAEPLPSWWKVQRVGRS